VWFRRLRWRFARVRRVQWIHRGADTLDQRSAGHGGDRAEHRAHGAVHRDIRHPLPSDPAEVKVAADFREAMVLWHVSQEKRALVPPVTSYVTGAALTTLKTTLTTFNKQNLIPAGTDRLFKTDIVAVTNPTATITSCDDGSKFTEINLSPTPWTRRS
jgi:hypothetical protein